MGLSNKSDKSKLRTAFNTHNQIAYDPKINTPWKHFKQLGVNNHGSIRYEYECCTKIQYVQLGGIRTHIYNNEDGK